MFCNRDRLLKVGDVIVIPTHPSAGWVIVETEYRPSGGQGMGTHPCSFRLDCVDFYDQKTKTTIYIGGWDGPKWHDDIYGEKELKPKFRAVARWEKT